MEKTNPDKRFAELLRLRRSGVPIKVDESQVFPDSPLTGLFIRQIPTSRAIEMGRYRTAYVIHVRIVSNLPGPFAISSFRLELPWGNPHMVLLDDPAEHVPPSNFYRFPGRSPVFFRRKEVLNHRDNIRFELLRGHALQGFVLWYADEPIPEDYVHGDDVPSFIVIVNQFGREYRGTVSLHIDRTCRLIPKVPRKHSRRDITGKCGMEIGHSRCPEGEHPSYEESGEAVGPDATRNGLAVEREVQPSARQNVYPIDRRANDSASHQG